MIGALQFYRTWAHYELLSDWPRSAPASMQHMPIQEAWEVLRQARSFMEMPSAELTPELLAQRIELSLEEMKDLNALMGVGRWLLNFGNPDEGESFWEECSIYAPDLTRSVLKLAVTLAQWAED